MKPNEYHDQADAFLARNGLKMRITLSDTKTPQWEEPVKECHTCEGTGKQKKGWPMDRPGKCLFCSGTGKKAAHRHHYRVTVSRMDRDAKKRELSRLFPETPIAKQLAKEIASSRITFDFWGSIADAQAKRNPHPYDVLACISGDTATPETFAAWCAEYGDDPDSIKALQTFRRCSAFAKRLRAFFTPAELEQLSEIR